VKRGFRLARSIDFQRVRRIGKSYAHPLVVLIIAPNDLENLRVGIVAGRSVGNAVQRNRAKRRLRACFSSLLPDLQESKDIILLARKPVDQAGYLEIFAAVQGLLKRAGMLDDRA